MSEEIEGLPWRGPGAGRPRPAAAGRKLPLRRGGRRRKRRRYVAAYSDELLICAARVHVGTLAQSFWAICDREGREMWERTRMRLPGARGEVWTEHLGGEEVVAELGDVGVLDYAPDEGSLVRIDSEVRGPDDARAFLRLGGGRWVESVCPTDEGEYVWTRKRADVPVECDVRDRRPALAGRGARGGGRVGGLPPPPHRLELVHRRRPDQRRPLGRLEPGQRNQRPAGALGARDLDRRRAHRAGAGPLRRARRDRLRRRFTLALRQGVRALQGRRTGPSSATRTGSRSARSAARFQAASSWQNGLGVMEFHDAVW